jgi:multidrug efflux pump subunit AcrB
MNKIIKKVIEYRRIALFFTVIVILAGAYSYYLLPRQESPDVSVPIAMIVTPYPGASASDVHDLVTEKIEDEMDNLNGYDYCKGVSKENVSIVTVYFKSDVDNDLAMQDVRNAVNDVQAELPDGIRESTVNTDVTETAGMIISVSGGNYSYDQLESFGEDFKEELRDIEGISRVDLVGKLDKEVTVSVDAAKLNRLALSMEDLCTVLAAQNVQIPSGPIEYESGKITVNTPGTYTSVEDIGNTIISVSKDSGIVTRLKDIASVSMETEEGVQKIKSNGQNAILLTAYFVDNQNIVNIGKDVRRAVESVEKGLPPDLTVNEVIYQPDSVSRSTNEFMLHLVIGIVLVLAAVFMAMGIRNALVISTSIPLSILIAFTMMYVNGVQIHQVSLTALIIALGILVDDAIVVTDNIQVRVDAGDAPVIAAYHGAARCTVPNFSATMAIILAFAPLLGIPGSPGQFLHDVPWVVIVSVGASYFVAMLVVPCLMADFAKAKHEKRRVEVLKTFFQKLLVIGLKNKKRTVVSAAAALVLVMSAVMPLLTSQFFPYVDKDMLYIQINSEKQGDMDRTEALAAEVENQLKTIPEVTDCTLSVADGLPKFYITMPPPMPSDDYAQLLVKFNLDHSKQFRSNVELSHYIQSLLDRNISGGVFKVKLLEVAIPTDAKVIVKVSGEEIGRLVQVAEELKQKISEIPGALNVRDNWDKDSIQLCVEIDEDKAASLGVSKYDVQKEINMALYGYDASVYRKDGNEFNIKVKSNVDSVAELSNFYIKSSVTGNKIPLKEFAQVTWSDKANTIRTYNGDLTVDILADPKPGYDSSKMENRIENEILPQMNLEGVNITFAGEREDIRENFTALGLLAVVSIFLIYSVLLLIFKSFVQPLVILTTIPLSLIGSVLGLFLFRQPISFTAFLGIISLVGLVVKNGILLIDFINEDRKNGCSIDEACVNAVSRRFNAVITSAITVILALIPLALSNSSLFTPMAVALMSGLTISTFLTMVVVPVIYSIVESRFKAVQK